MCPKTDVVHMIICLYEQLFVKKFWLICFFCKFVTIKR